MFFGSLDPMWDDQKDSNYRERFATGVLVLIILLVGLWPFPFIEVIEAGVTPILGDMQVLSS